MLLKLDILCFMSGDGCLTYRNMSANVHFVFVNGRFCNKSC